MEERKLIPSHQYGFREKHSTIEQAHRITKIIEDSLENKKICSSIFLDVAQAFDRVWHLGFKHKGPTKAILSDLKILYRRQIFSSKI